MAEQKDDKISSSQRASLTKSVGVPANQASLPAVGAGTGRQVMRFMPTYRLGPKNPLNKEVCENAIKEVMNRIFETFTYHPKQSLNLAAQVSEEIKNRVKAYAFDRYRYIVVVTIGERLMQGYYSLVNFLWDAEKDGYISYVYDTPNFFAVATLYYLYYD